MKLNKLPPKSLFRLDEPAIARRDAPPLLAGEVCWLARIDGPLAFCVDSAGRIAHLAASIEVTPVPATGYRLLAEGAAIQCLACGMMSHSAGDVHNRYCHNCKRYHGETVGDSDLHPYKVKKQPDGQWACISPSLGVIPEWTYPTEREAIARAKANLREDDE